MWIDTLNTIVIISIMFGVGSAIDPKDLDYIRRKPKAWLIGLGFQMLLLPLLAFIIAFLAPVSDVFKVGIFILSLCPGGTTSNFICHLANGDLALSISLTTVNSFLILFTIPFFSGLGLDFFMKSHTDFQLPFYSTLVQVFSLLLLPAALGFTFRYFFPQAASKFQYYVKWINLVLLCLVYGAKFFVSESSGGSGIVFDEILMLLPWVLLLHLLGLFGSRWGALNLGLNNRKSTTIGIEVGLQNTTLAIYICAVLLANQDMSKPALVMAMFSFFTSFAFAMYYLRKKVK